MNSVRVVERKDFYGRIFYIVEVRGQHVLDDWKNHKLGASYNTKEEAIEIAKDLEVLYERRNYCKIIYP